MYRTTICSAVCLSIVMLATAAVSKASTYNDAVLADNPLFYWTFDEASGNAIDQVNGLVADELVPQNNAIRVPSTTAGTISLGQAASFDGTGGTRFNAADLTGTFVGTKWAVEMWVQVDDPLMNSYFMESADVTITPAVPNNPSIIHGYNDNVLELFEGNRTGAGGPTTLSDGQWHHLVVGNDTVAGQHTFIFDGGTPVSFPGTPGAVASNFALGQLAVGNTGPNGGTDGLNGQIDELALYDLSNAPDFSAALQNIGQHANPVPEPSGFLLAALAAAAAGSGLLWRRKRLVRG